MRSRTSATPSRCAPPFRSSGSLRSAVDSLGIRGACGVVGAPPIGTPASIDVNTVLVGGRTIRGIVEGDSVPDVFLPRLIELYRQGRYPLDRLVSYYELGDVNRAA